MAEHEPGQPFDEAAALARLETLLRNIQAARDARQRKVDEFDAFLKSFRQSEPLPAPVTPSSPSMDVPDVTPSPVVMPEPSRGAVADHEPSALVVPEPSRPVASEGPATVAKASSRRAGRTFVYAAAVATMIAIGVLSYEWRKAAHDGQGEAPVVREDRGPAAGLPPPRSAPAAAPTAPAPVPARPVDVELTTLAPVWMRVIVDGRKELEALVPKGERLHFGAERSVVVRAGNGTSVLITTSGKQGPLGREAQPITRTFSRPE